MPKIILSVFVIILSVTSVWAHDDGDPADHHDEVDVSEAVVPEYPTYYEHVKPILELHCTACHSEGQIAGDIPLDTLESAVNGASDIAFNVSIGYMPPWMPSDLSLPMQHDRSLTDSEIATLMAWSDDFAPEGDPADYTSPADRFAMIEVREDMILQSEEPYEPDETVQDDYRCFAFQMELDEPQYLVAYEFLPDVMEMAHHGIIYKVNETALRGVERRNGEDGRPGWSCYGGVGLSVGDDEMIGTWTPGTLPVAFPEDTGYKIEDGDFLIIQMHYNLAITRQPDSTMVKLQFADEPVRELMTIQLTAPVEIPCPSDIDGPECDRVNALTRIDNLYGDGLRYFPDSLLRGCDQTLNDYAENTGEHAIGSCDTTAPIPLTLYGVFGHMHELGRSFHLEVNPDSDDSVMLLDIPIWDFHWQDRYQFVEPFQINRGDVVRITCSWDNTLSENPRYVVWGEGTEDEMCFATLTALVPGQ